jgi:ACS family hexuronate transporter-like MFS transporter
MNAAHAPNYNRWLLFTLLAFAGILNLVDRQIIAVLKPEMSAELGWSDEDYGALGASFQGAMAIGLLFAGPIVDKVGVKWANPLGVFAWSIAALAHGLAHTIPQFILCRIGLGATEAMGTPSMIKTVATIMPANIRSTGFGLIQALNSLGAIGAPVLIPLLAQPFGWRGTFVVAGLAGVVWTVVWLSVTRKTKFEDSHQEAPAAVETGPRPSMLKDRSTWGIAGAKVLSDATWWLLLFWMPDFMNRQYGLTGVELGGPLALAYTGAAVGSLVSGTMATRLLSTGMPVNHVRKGIMLVCGLMVLVLPLAPCTEPVDRRGNPGGGSGGPPGLFHQSVRADHRRDADGEGRPRNQLRSVLRQYRRYGHRLDRRQGPYVGPGLCAAVRFRGLVLSAGAAVDPALDPPHQALGRPLGRAGFPPLRAYAPSASHSSRVIPRLVRGIHWTQR